MQYAASHLQQQNIQKINMENKKPDNVVYSEIDGYNAKNRTFGTSVSAPVIQIDDVVSWKNRGVTNVNKQLQNKFDELKQQFNDLMQEFEWNQIVYNAKFSFEPVIGEIYHLYANNDGTNSLSLIAPNEWNKEHLGSFKLNSDKKWVAIT